MTIELNAYSIPELKQLIEKAQSEIVRKEQVQVKEVRTKMEELASSVGLSLEDVLKFSAGGKGRKAGKPAGVVRFRNPANPDQTWSGRGKQPNWLKDAMARGATKDDFAV